MNHRKRLLRLGFSVVEILVAIAIALPTTYAIASATGQLSHANNTLRNENNARSDVEGILDQFDEQSRSALAVFTSCGLNQTCSDVRFVSKNGAGNYQYFGWSWNSGARTLQYCTFAEANASCTPVGPSHPVTAFNATVKTAAEVAPPMLGGYTPKDVAYEAADSGSDIGRLAIAGNRVTVVRIANTYESREKHLIAGGVPMSANLLQTTTDWAPPIFQLNVNPNSLTIFAGSTGSFEADSDLQNQAATAPGVPPNLTLNTSITSDSGAGCSVNPGSGSSFSSFSVGASNPGSCTVGVSEKNGDNGTVFVNVVAPPTPGPSGTPCVGSGCDPVTQPTTPPPTPPVPTPSAMLPCTGEPQDGGGNYVWSTNGNDPYDNSPWNPGGNGGQIVYALDASCNGVAFVAGTNAILGGSPQFGSFCSGDVCNPYDAAIMMLATTDNGKTFAQEGATNVSAGLPTNVATLIPYLLCGNFGGVQVSGTYISPGGEASTMAQIAYQDLGQAGWCSGPPGGW